MALPVEKVHQLSVQSRVKAQEIDRRIATLRAKIASNERLAVGVAAALKLNYIDTSVCGNVGADPGYHAYIERQIAQLSMEAAQWREQEAYNASGVVFMNRFFQSNSDFMTNSAVSAALSAGLAVYGPDNIVVELRTGTPVPGV
jgi:hypothetical protein